LSEKDLLVAIEISKKYIEFLGSNSDNSAVYDFMGLTASSWFLTLLTLGPEDGVDILA
jgi:hypothetical protein